MLSKVEVKEKCDYFNSSIDKIMKSQIVKFIVLSANDGLQLHSKVSQL